MSAHAQPSATGTDLVDVSDVLDDAMVESYRRDGFVRIRSAISPQEAARFAAAVDGARRAVSDLHRGSTFTQLVNVWQHEPTLRELTLHPRLAALATRLAGVPLRLWHDHLLIKEPHNGAATHFHQDAPYWPHVTADGGRGGIALSAWVALVDVPAERGCMTFLPGSHDHVGLRSQDLTDPGDLFSIAPDLRWHERVTLPLRAGDCTFHTSWTAHTAQPNDTDDPRIAHVVIFMDADTRYTGARHPVADGLGLEPGRPFEHDLFPLLPVR